MRQVQVVSGGGALAPLQAVGRPRLKILMVDLNNFSTFPTLAIGLLIASLRNVGHEVQLISPLAHDVPAAERERAEGYLDHLARKVHHTTWPPVRAARDLARLARRTAVEQPHPVVIAETTRALRERPDAILLSAYLQHYRTVEAIGKQAAALGVPLLLGGPMFSEAATTEAWRTIPGLSAIVGGEVDLALPSIVETLCSGGDLLQYRGVTLPDGHRSEPAPPLRELDSSPVPDFTDFPWDRYRVHIIPMMASRGCQWSKCSFCSDIVSVSGRTFRTRSVESVLHEMREQARRHQTKNFLFLDLKLNSNPALMRGIVERVQEHVRGAQWIGTVHVDQRKDNGLSFPELKAAVNAGMRRVSFGMETGSQPLLDRMVKGATVEGNSAFIRNAHQAGLSVRATMFRGYPGETVDDLEATTRFLEDHVEQIDRLRFNDFSIPQGTPIFFETTAAETPHPIIDVRRLDARRARAVYVSRDTKSRAYRQAKARLLRAVYAINRRPIRSSARAFDGLM